MQKATQMTATKRLVLTAVNIALCLVLPMAFHSIPNGGKIMLPMHIPVLLCGMVCGAPYGAVCGLLIAEFYERKGDKKHDGAA